MATIVVHSRVKNNTVIQTNVMTLLKAKSMYIAEGKANEKQMYTGEYFELNAMCGFFWAHVSLARGEREYI